MNRGTVHRWTGRAAAAAAVVAVGALVGGCGGSSSESASTTTTATDAWASTVCSALTVWKSSVEQARASVADPGSVSKDSLTAAIDSVRTANQKLADSVQQLEPPPTITGGEATQIVSNLRDQLDSGRKEIQAILASPDTTQPLNSVSRVTGKLAEMRVQVQSAVDGIQKLDVKGDLGAAFTQSPACAPFTGG